MREEAIMILRRFYLTENTNGKWAPCKWEGGREGAQGPSDLLLSSDRSSIPSRHSPKPEKQSSTRAQDRYPTSGRVDARSRRSTDVQEAITDTSPPALSDRDHDRQQSKNSKKDGNRIVLTRDGVIVLSWAGQVLDDVTIVVDDGW